MDVLFSCSTFYYFRYFLGNKFSGIGRRTAAATTIFFLELNGPRSGRKVVVEVLGE